MDYRERWELKDYLVGRTLERRILLFHVGVVAVVLGFVLNFWYLQGVHGETYANLAENNRLRRIPMLPTRGVIFDTQKAVIASTRPSLHLVLLREEAHEIEPQLRRLAPILGTSYEALEARFEKLRDRPLYEPLVLREDVSLEALARIEARRELFPSVEVSETAQRSYPQGDLFGHVLGYVGEVNERRLAEETESLRLGDIVGQTGVELAYDAWLRGDRGWNLVSVNSLGRRMGGSWVGQEPQHGNALDLTLDLRLQRALREGLGEEEGAGVFLDPRTGEVLAMVSTPAFDPNLFADGLSRRTWHAIVEDPHQPLHDRAVTSAYAPGSTFKVVMAALGLETGSITPEETVHCNGQTTIYGQRRLCWKRGGHGTVDLSRALAQSCNVYFYHLGARVGIDAIHEFGKRFKLGEPTGVDLPREAEGILPSRRWKRRHKGEIWYPGDTVSVAIGQGLLELTPIQLTRMISAVATAGHLPRPHLVKREAAVGGESIDLRPETWRLIRDALREAVADGTGGRAGLEGVAVAGKTGTAQVYRHSAGIDSDQLPKSERDHGWFVGYAPADDPQVAFAVIVEHGGHGSSSAAPIVRRVLEVFFAEQLDEFEREKRNATQPTAG